MKKNYCKYKLIRINEESQIQPMLILVTAEMSILFSGSGGIRMDFSVNCTFREQVIHIKNNDCVGGTGEIAQQVKCLHCTQSAQIQLCVCSPPKSH